MAFNKKTHHRQNIYALKTAFTLDRERRAPTPEEERTLGAYSGFGAIKEVLAPPTGKSDKDGMATLVAELHEVIRANTPDEREYKRYMDGIKNSVLTAFYTSPKVADTIVGRYGTRGSPPTEAPKDRRKQATGTPRTGSLFDTLDNLEEEEPGKEMPQIREADMKPRPFEGEVAPYFREGTLVTDGQNRVGYLRGIESLQPMFHPLELTPAQRTKASMYIEIRDAYYHLYNNEAETLTTNPALREMLNQLYDNFTERFGRLNDKCNLDLIKMGAEGRRFYRWSVTSTARHAKPTSSSVPCLQSR